MTPLKALYGRDPPNIIKLEDDASPVEDVNIQLKKTDTVIAELKDNLEMAKQRMRQQANKKRREVSLKVGDTAYLKISPYKLKSLAKKMNEKLSPRYYGPYKILERIGEVAYLGTTAYVLYPSDFSYFPTQEKLA